MLLWLPSIGILRIPFPLNSIEHLPLYNFGADNILHLVLLTQHITTYNNSLNRLLRMIQEQFDDCFEIQWNLKKVQSVKFINSNTVLVLHVPYRYSIFRIVDRNTSNLLKQGTIPELAQSVQIYNEQIIVFIVKNQLNIFHLYEQKVREVYEISQSNIYTQQFYFSIFKTGIDSLILFYKSSILKITPITITYQLHLLKNNQKLQEVKRIKVEYSDIRKFAYFCGQAISYQIKGYTIQINFLQSNQFQRIQSIYSLLLIDVRLQTQFLIFYFTHEELKNQFSVWAVDKKKTKRLDRVSNPMQAHVYESENRKRSIVLKNYFNLRKKDHNIAIFRMKALKKSKYLSILNHILPPDIEDSFKQTIIQMLE